MRTNVEPRKLDLFIKSFFSYIIRSIDDFLSDHKDIIKVVFELFQCRLENKIIYFTLLSPAPDPPLLLSRILCRIESSFKYDWPGISSYCILSFRRLNLSFFYICLIVLFSLWTAIKLLLKMPFIYQTYKNSRASIMFSSWNFYLAHYYAQELLNLKWQLWLNLFRWDYYKEGQSIYKSMDPMIAYQKGLTTWAKWVELNLDPRKTRVFFRSMSPRHNRCYSVISAIIFISKHGLWFQFWCLKIFASFSYAAKTVGNAITRGSL